MRARSSRVLRDVGYEMYSVEENWDERHIGEVPAAPKERDKPRQATHPGAALIASFAIGLALFGTIGRNGTNTIDPVPNSGGRKTGFMEDLINKIPSGPPAIAMKDTFSNGLSNWQGLSSGISGWKLDGGLIHPGDLKIWKNSLALSNYRLQFEGKIDRKGMSWAFRAPNLQNYYATKINLAGNGKNGSSAEIVRYFVQNGKAGTKETLPLPMLVRASEFFRVDVKIKDNRFTTSIDGRVVDIWQDDRFRNGGVGFFNEKGELSALKWVALSEADTFAEKMKSLLYLSYIIPPPVW